MILKPLLPLFVIIAALVLAGGAALYCIINQNHRKSSYFIRISIVAVIALALARPIFVLDQKAVVATSNTVIYLIIDSTGSMATEDESGKARIEVAREDMKKVIDSFVAPKVGVFIQDVITYQLLPITSDLNTARDLVGNILVKNNSSSESTDLAKLIKNASKHFERYHRNNPDADILIFIMSDGESFGQEKEYELKKDDFNGARFGAVIGYGSDSGGKVPHIIVRSDETGGIEYAEDVVDPYLTRNGKEIISRKNTSFLRSISNTYSFSYGESENIDALVSEAKSHIGKPTATDDTATVGSAFETYWIFMILAGVLLLLEFSRDFNSLLAEREVKK